MRAADYRPGERVELVHTTDPYTRLRPGDRGTVTLVDALGTVHVSWDNGARLGMVPGEDTIRHVQARHDHGCALCRQVQP